MSEMTAEAPVPPEEVPESWKEEFGRLWLQTRLGHEAMMLDKMQKQNAEVMALAKATRTGTVGQPDAPEGEDMGVSIGNKEYHYHYANSQTATTSAPTAAPQAATTTTQGSTVSNLAKTAGKYALLAALAGGSSGLGALVASYFLKSDSTVINQLDPNAYDISGSVEPIE